MAELPHLVGYIERVGSGFVRMKASLASNNNPPLDVSASNFFLIRFFRRIDKANVAKLTPRQVQLLEFIRQRKVVQKNDIVKFLDVSPDTALRDINVLVELELTERVGTGKATQYQYRS